MFMLLLMALVSCSSSEEAVKELENETGSETEFVDDPGPALTAAQEETFNENVNVFTFNMFRALANRNAGQSLVSSPLSAATVLAMLNDGAMGKTREELLEVLGFGEAKTRAMNEYFQKLMQAEGKYGTKLQISDGMFVSQGYDFKPSFVNDMRLYYDAPAEVLDFSQPASVDHINNWCAEHTNGVIPRIVETLQPDAISVFLNAIFFKGKWLNQFNEKKTKQQKFTLEDNTQKNVPMMQIRKDMYYYEDDLCQAVCLNYSDVDYAMTVLLPKPGRKVIDIIGSLTEEWWKSLNANITYSSEEGNEVMLSLPRFSVETKGDAMEDLSGVLSDMGVHSMFNPATAQFPNILTTAGLYVSQIVQKATIDVNEEGTVAAAVTSGFLYGSPGPQPGVVTFTADHPFVYVISNQRTGIVFFIGTYQG